MSKCFVMKGIALLVIYVLLGASLAFGDGVFFAQQLKHLYAPEQKAVILWDGQKESMVISSKVNSSDITDLAHIVWLIPLESSRKPEVNPSDISLFETFIYYFMPPQKYEGGKDASSMESSLSLLETKKIDVYDIAILRATDPQELIDWLNSNGYVFPESAVSLINRYIENKWYYFVANKIDLSNKFSSDSMRAQALLDGMISNRNDFNSFIRSLPPGMISEMERWLGDLKRKRRAAEPFRVQTCFNAILDCLRRSVIISVLKGIPFDDSVANTQIGEVLNFISREKYELLLKTCTLRDGVYEKLSLWGSDYYWSDFVIGDWMGQKTFTNRYTPDSEIIIDLDRGMHCSGGRVVLGLGSIEKNLRLQSISIEDYGKFLKENLYDIQEKYRIVFEALNLKNMRSFSSVIEEITQLSLGIATPLKIDFYPQNPLYPLAISGINSGKTKIEIYFCAPYAAEDYTGLLRIDSVKTIPSQIKESTRQHLDLNKANYVTRLLYYGELSGVRGDALFRKRIP